MTSNIDFHAPLQGLADLRQAGMPNLVARAIEIFKTEWPKSTIEEALSDMNLKPERFAAHTLKSNGAHVGYKVLVDLCFESEIAARDENVAICTTVVENLNDLFNRYCVELDSYTTKAA